MRLLHIDHPDKVDDLPAGFSEWVLAFASAEAEAKAEAEKEAVRGSGVPGGT